MCDPTLSALVNIFRLVDPLYSEKTLVTLTKKTIMKRFVLVNSVFLMFPSGEGIKMISIKYTFSLLFKFFVGKEFY